MAKKEIFKTRSELLWLLVPIIVLLSGWYIYNRYIGDFYAPDFSEGGKYKVITYSTQNHYPRQQQVGIFNRLYEQDKLKVQIVPTEGVIIKTAAGDPPDMIGLLSYSIKEYVDRGIVTPINEQLKRWRDEEGMDMRDIIHHSQLEDIRYPNPNWKEGDDEMDRWLWYGVPSNIEVMVTWFNKTLYEKVKLELGDATPRAPWLHWTWWDYTKLARALQRKNEDGKFLTFGSIAFSQARYFDRFYLQIGLSMRGNDRKAFENLTFKQRKKYGLGSLSWDSAADLFVKNDDGTYQMYPNRRALKQTFQLVHDATHLMEAYPTATDMSQMASAGNNTELNYGNTGGAQFVSGDIGLLIQGRWYLRYIRAKASFDWRLYRNPRWVPYEVWADWERRGLKPEERDGEWGEAKGGDPYRGYGAFMYGSRVLFSKNIVKKGLLDEAFEFAKFMLTDEEYNLKLLLEDASGPNLKIAKDYLSKPDPFYPDEVRQRPVKHELGVLEHVYYKQRWPYLNWNLGYHKTVRNIKSWINNEVVLDDEKLNVDYSALGVKRKGNSEVGEYLMNRFIDELKIAEQEGIEEKKASYNLLPSVNSFIFLIFSTFFLAFFVLSTLKKKKEDS